MPFSVSHLIPRRRRSRLGRSFLLLPVLAAAAGLATGADTPAPDPRQATYVQEIRPLFEQYCFSCHGAEKPRGDVSLSAFGTVVSIQTNQATSHQM